MANSWDMIFGSAFAANTVLASPNGSTGPLTPRALVATDIPSLSATYLPLAGGTMTGDLNITSGIVIKWNSDSGISRISPGALAFGNGAAGDFTGTLKLTTLTAVGGLSSGSVGSAGVLSLVGSTSGTATITAPAIAGTNSNPIVSSNSLLLPFGSSGFPSLQIGDSSVGFYQLTTGQLTIVTSGGTGVGVKATNLLVSGAALVFTTNSNDMGATTDTGLSRLGAASLAIGNGTAGDVSGTLTLASEVVKTANAATWTLGQISELITLSTSGSTTDSSANLLPANSIIEAVVARVTTTITTATDWKLGDATTAGRFSAPNSTLTAGTTQVGTVQADQTGAAGPRQVAAVKLRITTTGTPGAGVIRVTVFYRSFSAPTS